MRRTTACNWLCLSFFPQKNFPGAGFFVFKGAEFWPDSGRPGGWGEGGESPSVGTRRGLILFRFFLFRISPPIFPFFSYLFPPKIITNNITTILPVSGTYHNDAVLFELGLQGLRFLGRDAEVKMPQLVSARCRDVASCEASNIAVPKQVLW